MKVPAEIFRAYDIRGIAGRTLTPEVVRAVGRVLGSMAREFAVGRDGRDSGPGLDPDLVLETEDVIAGRAGVRPPRMLGFGLRLAGRLVRTLGASLTIAPSATGTVCHLVIPALTARVSQTATA